MKIPSNVKIFCNHLNAGLEAANLDIEDFYPCWITNNETGDNGFLFMQIKGDRETGVEVYEDRIEFVGHTVSLMLDNELPPSIAAVMFAVAIVQKEPIVPPSCPCCAEEEIQQKRRLSFTFPNGKTHSFLTHKKHKYAVVSTSKHASLGAFYTDDYAKAVKRANHYSRQNNIGGQFVVVEIKELV